MPSPGPLGGSSRAQALSQGGPDPPDAPSTCLLLPETGNGLDDDDHEHQERVSEDRSERGRKERDGQSLETPADGMQTCIHRDLLVARHRRRHNVGGR